MFEVHNWDEVKADAGRFRKKPLVIEAVQINEHFQVKTLEGMVTARESEAIREGFCSWNRLWKWLEVHSNGEELYRIEFELIKDSIKGGLGSA